MTATTLSATAPTATPAPAAEPWPTEAHRARMTAAAEAGWNTAMATYEAANERLEDRVTDPKRKEMQGPELDKAILEDARFAGAIKTAWSTVETAYRAMTLARPVEAPPAGETGAPAAARKAAELRRPDAESVAESRRRLGAIDDGREPAAEPAEAADAPAGPVDGSPVDPAVMPVAPAQAAPPDRVAADRVDAPAPEEGPRGKAPGESRP
jgi:hypothetical protein